MLPLLWWWRGVVVMGKVGSGRLPTRRSRRSRAISFLHTPKLPKVGVEFEEGCEKGSNDHVAVNQRPKV
jgi:hypothetical protein